jgi:hypothetical protein
MLLPCVAGSCADCEHEVDDYTRTSGKPGIAELYPSSLTSLDRRTGSIDNAIDVL